MKITKTFELNNGPIYKRITQLKIGLSQIKEINKINTLRPYQMVRMIYIYIYGN